MKRTANLISLIISASMFISALSSCGGGNTVSSTEPPISSTETSTSAVQTTSAPEVTEQGTADAHISVDGTKFVVGGKEIWLSGGNTPWYGWNDFSGRMNDEKWEQTFEMLEADHINCTRIWINCDGKSIVNVKSSGHFNYMNDEHFEDLDRLFDMAARHKVYVMATLLSFDHFKNKDWQAVLSSKETCDEYAENYVKPFCERYADNDYVFAIDIMNEPDWVYEKDECGKISWDNISYLFGKCADTIHKTCNKLVTVGTGIIKYNSDKYEGNKVSDAYLKELTGLDGAYLDFYSVHYYDWQMPWFGFPFDKSPEEFGLVYDRPCVIGETSNDNEKKFRMTLPEIYKSMYDNGWNGLLVWMEPRKDEEQIWYRYDLTREATNAQYEYIPEKIDPLGAWKEDVSAERF